MIARRGRIVLYFPMMGNPALGAVTSKDLLPISLLSIAAGPDRAGYEVVIVDGNLYSQAEAHARVVDACEGALLYGTTGILGYQVADAFLCTREVKRAHPDLPAFVGGWFASCAPELQLETGLYDAVCVGQGEVTFGELIAAVEAGEALDGIAGLALWRDGEVVRTDRRAIVGLEEQPRCPWHLIDIEPYKAAQLAGRAPREVERMPPPPGFEDRPFFGISYYSSFGCPEPCTFCCSPGISRRRWKSLSAGRMLDELSELKERWGIQTVRFYDANWGVDERRTREFCEGLLERDLKLWWYCLMQSHSALGYDAATLDAMRDSGVYLVNLGGETGDEEMMRAIGKHTRSGENERAAWELDRRGVRTWVTYIIGYPYEAAESMMNPLAECRRIAARCERARAAVWPYRPIPGSALYPKALELGYQPPRTLEEWGTIGEYHLDETWPGKGPPHVDRTRRLFEHLSSLKFGLPRGRVGWWERRATRRLETGDYRGARLEAKAFDLYLRLARTVRVAGGR